MVSKVEIGSAIVINTSRYLQNFTETATEKEIETIENCVCISFSSAIKSVWQCLGFAFEQFCTIKYYLILY